MSQQWNRSTFGWIFYDFANSAFATTILAVIFNQYYAEVVAGGAAGTLFHFPWGEYHIQGSVVWSYIVAASTAIVAVSSPLLGAMADLSNRRKRLLVIYCYVGVVATISLTLVGAGDVMLGAVLFAVANLGFAGGNVFYNAFLIDVSSRKSFGKISGLSWGLGYLGGGLCLVLNLIMLQKPQLLGFEAGYFTVSDCLIVAGVWWGLFALPTVLWLKDESAKDQPRVSLRTLTRASWHRLVATFKSIKHYRQLKRFLIAYLLLNDGVETVILMASIFGVQVVGMSTAEIIGYFIMVQATAMIGSLFFGWLSDLIGNKITILITTVVWVVIVLWAFQLGWLIDLKSDFYIIGVLAGLVMGGCQTTARAMQALFTPKEKSAEFFGFFAVSGRFASVFGPLIYGSAILIFGDIHYGILSLVVFFVAGGLLLWRVDEREGERIALTPHRESTVS